MEIIELPIKSIFPYKNNPRHNDKAVEFVANSLRQFGWKQPIVIDEKYEIVAGHTRWKAAKMLGMETVPCVMADDLTPEQVQVYRLTDNKTAEMADWDFDLLEQELNDIDPAMFDMADFGFFQGDEPETSNKAQEVEEDDFDPDAEAESRCKRGQIWQLGAHRLMCGDSTSADDVAKLMNGEKADMVFTDPPWNVNYGAVKEDNAMGYKVRTILNDHMETDEFKKFMKSVFTVMNGSSKPGAMTYVVMSAQEWGNLMLTLGESGFHWSSTIIWNKDHFVMSRKDYHTKYEPIWYGWKEGNSRLHPLSDRTQSDVWDFARPIKSEEHPTMKPVSLVARAIENSTNNGDIVLDLFGGSGTTLIAAEQLQRSCRMMELDPHYCDVILKRWEDFTGQEAVLLEE